MPLVAVRTAAPRANLTLGPPGGPPPLLLLLASPMEQARKGLGDVLGHEPPTHASVGQKLFVSAHDDRPLAGLVDPHQYRRHAGKAARAPVAPRWAV